jgi:dihydrodipicolinate synthase/N-acetylneuraminate lyase
MSTSLPTTGALVTTSDPHAAPRALTGALPALVTPLSDPTTLDLDGVATLVRRALADGASGVLVAGSTGEGSLLDPDQRAAVTALARDAIDSHPDDPVAGEALAGPALAARRPVLVAGASSPSLATLQADVARLAAAGADLVLVLPPSVQPLLPDELVDLHLAVADAAEIDTLLYHIPQLTGSSLTPDGVQRLARHDRIVGMKDSSPQADRRAAFVAVTREIAGFAVVTGHAPTLAAALAAGVDGSITAVANVRLRQVLALHRAVAAGATAEVARLQESLVRLTQGIGEVGVSVPAVLKAALQLDGLLAERWCTPPLHSVPPGRLDHVRTALLR